MSPVQERKVSKATVVTGCKIVTVQTDCYKARILWGGGQRALVTTATTSVAGIWMKLSYEITSVNCPELHGQALSFKDVTFKKYQHTRLLN